MRSAGKVPTTVMTHHKALSLLPLFSRLFGFRFLGLSRFFGLLLRFSRSSLGPLDLCNLNCVRWSHELAWQENLRTQHIRGVEFGDDAHCFVVFARHFDRLKAMIKR